MTENNPPKKRGRGRPSKKELNDIALQARTSTPEQIAASTGRSVLSITKALGNDEDLAETQEIIQSFRLRPEYKHFCKQFTADEMQMFEHKYVNMLRQFKKDVLYTEESQMFLLITYDLLLAKNTVKIREIEESLVKIVLDIENLKLDMITMEEGSPQRKEAFENLRILNERHTGLTMAQGKIDKIVQDYTDIILKQWALIKGTRKDRIDVIENSKKTFFDMLKSFDNKKFRDDEGREAELMRISGEREKERLGQPHKYMDGNVDLPILSADTVGKLDEADSIREADTQEKEHE